MNKVNWHVIREEWETSEVTFKELAEKHGVKDSTIRSRKNREKWQRNGAPKKAQRATQQKQNVATKKEQFEPVVESDDLTEKQRLFCIYYIKYLNATKAYQKAYECAYNTAMVEGHRHLRNPKISSVIDCMKAEQASEIKLTARDVLQKYIDIALADVTDYITFGQRERQVMTMYGPLYEKDENGNVDKDKPVMETINYIDFKESTEIDGTIITEVKQGRDGISVKLADKMKAFEVLAKYTDLLSDNDKKRLQEEKLKADTAKAKAEAAKLAKENKQVAPPTITIVDAWSEE